MDKFFLKPGVLYGKDLLDLFDYCKKTECALPAVNVISSETIAAALQAAKKARSPIIIQFSYGGAAFYGGKFLDNSTHKASILGAVAGAMNINTLAREYGVSVVLHTDHCNKARLGWLEGLLAISEDYFNKFKVPLFSSHMIDLSELSLEENLDISSKFLKRVIEISSLLEVEVGLTGGEEDGIDSTSVKKSRLYTNPNDIMKVHQALSNIGRFNIAVAFGNTHGVYKPGNVQLRPEILKQCQDRVGQKTGERKPLNLVFHGGSGSDRGSIQKAVSYGVVKFNIDTDTQWAFTSPIKKYMDENTLYLKSQVGNPEGDDRPNKKYIDPRNWLFKGQQAMIDRLLTAFDVLGCFNRFAF